MDNLVDSSTNIRTNRPESLPKLSPLQRTFAWLDLMVLDHGVLRFFYGNRHRVTSQLWRSAQPTPFDLHREKQRGIRTIICVRGSYPFRPWPLEVEACRELGLDLHKVNIRAREAPTTADLLSLMDLFSEIEYPALIHCKSGADRSGFVAAVYLLAVEGRTADEAMRQLSLRFGHLRTSRAGIVGEVIRAYRDDGEARGLGFRQWIETEYDRDDITRRFEPRRFASAIVDQILRREG